MNDSSRCLLLNKHLSPNSPHITPVNYPSELDKADLVSLPKTITQSSSPEEKKQAKKQKESPKSHWMTNAGYALYAGVGAIKTISSFERGFLYDNPTMIVGNLSLLASFPAVFLTHGFYAKAFMLMANHLSEMAEAAVGFREQIKAADKQAQLYGHKVPVSKTVGLNGMKEWLDMGLLKRVFTFQQTLEDKKNLKAFTDYVVKDLNQAGREMINTLNATKKLTGEVAKKIITPSHVIKMPDAFKIGIHPHGDVRNIKALNNIYHISNTGAYGGIVGVGAEVIAHTLGFDRITTVFTRPWLMLSNLLQTAGALCSAKQIYSRTGNSVRETKKLKAMGIQEASGTVLEAVGAASWSNDWLLGIYRLGSLLRMPYRKYKTLHKADSKGNIVKVNLKDLKNKIGADKEEADKIITALHSENLSFLVDGVAAVLILGAPAVAWWEKKHHTTLNPIERRKALADKMKAKPSHTDAGGKVKGS
ncbi:MAG: hypothetical protein LW809_04700 [Vampirovibrionales bacterium]|jgi:hypothetical protein|nr:hypothetical protein [Vampirovibrionales bacterium]